MKKSNKFSLEIRELAVRVVQGLRGEYPSLWAAIKSIAPALGLRSTQPTVLGRGY